MMKRALISSLLLLSFPIGAQDLVSSEMFKRSEEEDAARRELRDMQVEMALDAFEAGIGNGLLTFDYPEVGVLLRGPSLAESSSKCTGTLIGCRAFLTAAHCVERPGSYYVYFQHAGFVEAEAPVPNPHYDFPTADIAILRLKEDVTGIRPARIPQRKPVGHGMTAAIVGFGRDEENRIDFGLKREGTVKVAKCNPEKTTDEVSICWDYANPRGIAGEDSNTCKGDSGGPLFALESMRPVVAGVTSGGTTKTCLTPDHSYDTRVSKYRGWLRQELGEMLSSNICGEYARVGSRTSPYFGTVATLASTEDTNEHKFTIEDGIEALRVNVNGVGSYVESLKLELKRNDEEVTCEMRQADTLAYCEIQKPEAGIWNVTVGIDEPRYGISSAKAVYQVVVTKLQSAEDAEDMGHGR